MDEMLRQLALPDSKSFPALFSAMQQQTLKTEEMMRKLKPPEVPQSERIRAMRNKIAPVIRENVLLMEGRTFSNDFDKTMVFAVMCNGYGDTEFEEDVQTVARRYNVPADKLLRYAIKGSDLIPNEDAAFQDISKIIPTLNNRNYTLPSDASADDIPAELLDPSVGVDPVRRLRIAEVGIKETKLLLDVLEYMLKQWKSPHKYIQFVHSSSKDQLFQFWKKACLKGLCNQVEYVNRADYTAIGTLDCK